MAMNKLSTRVADMAIEKVAALLADRVADRVVDALMKAGFDKQFANSLLESFRKAAEEANS